MLTIVPLLNYSMFKFVLFQDYKNVEAIILLKIKSHGCKKWPNHEIMQNKRDWKVQMPISVILLGY